MIDGALMTAGAAYILFVSSNFLTPFQSFIQLVSIGLSAWAAVVVIYLFGRWRSTAPRHGVSPAAVVAWVIGLILGLLFSSTSLFVGPLAKGIFATSSLSYVVSSSTSYSYGPGRRAAARPRPLWPARRPLAPAPRRARFPLIFWAPTPRSRHRTGPGCTTTRTPHPVRRILAGNILINQPFLQANASISAVPGHPASAHRRAALVQSSQLRNNEVSAWQVTRSVPSSGSEA